ncbi:hypothetical protein LCGC14_0741220 [marine sediment metagenome]|uniref:Uncharacterized protein n=1 Tax=marine sediment metagenome TaxID=412755 RepID=A0A0F9SRK6_9ZZZZ
MYFQVNGIIIDLEHNIVSALGSLDTAVTLTTPEDIGALTAEIVFYEPCIRNQIVYLAGDTVTYGEVANKLESVLQRTFQRREWTVPELMTELADDQSNHIKKYRTVFAQGRGVAWEKDTSFNGLMKISLQT